MTAAHGVVLNGQDVMENLFCLSPEKWENVIAGHRHYDIVIIGSGFCAFAVAERSLKRNPQCRILIVEGGTFCLFDHYQNGETQFPKHIRTTLMTYPWTLDKDGPDAPIQNQTGMVPFFGGRSVIWSGWCPRPTYKEMHQWPSKTKTAARQYFKSSEALLNVMPANKIDAELGKDMLDFVSSKRPVYRKLQAVLEKQLKSKYKHGNVHKVRVESARFATNNHRKSNGVSMGKFSVPAHLIDLVKDYEHLDIVTMCVVKKITEHNQHAIGLETSKGVIPLGGAKLVLAMGTLPNTTLVRNSFPQATNAGIRFSAHFMSSILARIPRSDLPSLGDVGPLETAGLYISGRAGDYKQQFHIQLNAVADRFPEQNSDITVRFLPEVLANASKSQFSCCKDYIVFDCAVLGELDACNERNGFEADETQRDVTKNSILKVSTNSNDEETWNVMDQVTFELLEQNLSPDGNNSVEYWHGQSDDGQWRNERPLIVQRRDRTLVHESSTLHIGDTETAPVDTDYKLRGTSNVYVTGGALWPLGGSWNPAMTMVALAQHLADTLVPERKSSVNSKL